MLIISLLLACLCKIVVNSDKKPITLLTLSADGNLNIDKENALTLHKNSRIGWLGCWLILTDDDHKHGHLFLFKDQLSTLDYSRLSRTILKNH